MVEVGSWLLLGCFIVWSIPLRRYFVRSNIRVDWRDIQYASTEKGIVRTHKIVYYWYFFVLSSTIAGLCSLFLGNRWGPTLRR